eukprot:7224369-Prymnesium_polylepis.2
MPAKTVRLLPLTPSAANGWCRCGPYPRRTQWRRSSPIAVGLAGDRVRLAMGSALWASSGPITNAAPLPTARGSRWPEGPCCACGVHGRTGGARLRARLRCSQRVAAAMGAGLSRQWGRASTYSGGTRTRAARIVPFAPLDFASHRCRSTSAARLPSPAGGWRDPRVDCNSACGATRGSTTRWATRRAPLA